MRVSFAVIALCMFTTTAAQEPPRASPAVLLQHAVRDLTQEAQDARGAGELTRREADFVHTFLSERGLARDHIPPRIAWNALRRPQSDAPFIDAYVRWQLTGFTAAIPAADALSNDDFESFLKALPPYLVNPGSDREIIDRINAALRLQRLSEQESEALMSLHHDLRERLRTISALNVPATRLREWVAEQVGDRGLRIHQVRIERLAALVSGGWNTERLKREIAGGLRGAVRDASFTPEQRARLAEQMRRLAGRRKPIVTRIAVSEGAAQAQFDEAAVYDFEVSEWIRIMHGK